MKKRRKTSVLFLVLAVVLAIWSARELRRGKESEVFDKFQKFSEIDQDKTKKIVNSDLVTQVKQTDFEAQESSVPRPQSLESSDWEVFKKRVTPVLDDFIEISQKCEDDIEELFDDLNIYDLNSEAFNLPEYSLSLLDAVMTSTLYAFNPNEIYDEFEYSVDANDDFMPIELNEMLKPLHGCLNAQLEGFIFSLLSASFGPQYNDEARDNIKNIILDHFLNAPILQTATISVLAFQLNVLQALIRSDLVSSKFSQRVYSLQEQLAEGFRHYNEIIYFEGEEISLDEKRIETYSDFRNRHYIQKEIQSILYSL